MNGKRVMMLTTLITLLAYAGWVLSQDEVKSLRGHNGADQTSASPDSRNWQVDGGAVPRDFALQPPLIPHSTDGFTITLDFNMCLNCHGVAGSEQSGAPVVSQTHFYDRDGKKLEDPSGLRYSCTQCHVKQRDTEPLVENEYKAAE